MGIVWDDGLFSVAIPNLASLPIPLSFITTPSPRKTLLSFPLEVVLPVTLTFPDIVISEPARATMPPPASNTVLPDMMPSLIFNTAPLLPLYTPPPAPASLPVIFTLRSVVSELLVMPPPPVRDLLPVMVIFSTTRSPSFKMPPAIRSAPPVILPVCSSL